MSQSQIRQARELGPPTASRVLAPLPGRASTTVRLIFGVILGIDAYLKWLPAFRNTYISQLKSVADGQPSWLHGWFDFWISLQSAAPTVFATLTGIAETGLALSLLLGAARRLGYTFGAGYMLLLWAVGEGFGGPYAAGSTDVGAGIVYALLFTALLALAPPACHEPCSLDRVLTPRWRWWHAIAEPHGRGHILPGHRQRELAALPPAPVPEHWPGGRTR